MSIIPESHLDLFADTTRAFAFLATLMNDGTPQLTPVWFSWDGELIWVNSAQGRQKDRNMRSRPTVAIVIPDPRNTYRYVQIRGRVVEITNAGAREHINFLNNKYHGVPVFPGDPAQVRVIYKIKPEHVQADE